MTETQIVHVNDIAHDDQQLEEKARVLCDEDVVLDLQETMGKDFGTVETSVCAILVKKDGPWGAVRVFSEPVTNLVTGPTQGDGFAIVVIKPGQTCRLFGTPSMRYFRRRGS
ncbi:MAG: hypothetical protein M1814_002244 [Vezdaea aestivalis]|nr:MAG: hypothetical protein M1814_002244 [Vezdaea aestivalis]